MARRKPQGYKPPTFITLRLYDEDWIERGTDWIRNCAPWRTGHRAPQVGPQSAGKRVPAEPGCLPEREYPVSSKVQYALGDPYIDLIINSE